MLSPAKNQALETQVEIGLRKEPPCGKEIDLYSNHGGPDSYSLYIYIYIYICIYIYVYIYICILLMHQEFPIMSMSMSYP